MLRGTARQVNPTFAQPPRSPRAGVREVLTPAMPLTTAPACGPLHPGSGTWNIGTTMEGTRNFAAGPNARSEPGDSPPCTAVGDVIETAEPLATAAATTTGNASARDPISTGSTTTRGTYMHCPVCCLRVEGRPQLIAHLRAVRDPNHKAALVSSMPIYQELRGLHVLPCPLGCGVL
jgi:hypothetical protein